MFPKNSLLRRITIRVSAITIAGIALTYAWVYYQIQLSADSVNEGSVVAQAHEIMSAVSERDGELRFRLPDDLVRPQEDQDGNFRFSIYDETGAVLFGSRWAPTQRSELPNLSTKDHLYQAEHTHPTPDTFIGSVFDKRVGSRRLTIQVERSSRNLETLVDTVIDEFFLHGAWLGFPFLFLLLVVISWTVRGAIVPLKVLSEQTSSIGPLSTDKRLDLTDVPQEVVPLVKAMNAALDRLDTGFRLQREFTGDIAHELRTPLAILSAHLETLDDRAVAGALRRDVQLISRIVSQLLRAAQLEGLTITAADTADLCQIADSIGDMMMPIAAVDRKAVIVNRHPRSVVVHGNPETILHAVRNLVENGLKFAPIATTVEITVDARGTISVSDHGIGIPEQDRANVFQRFWRGDQTGSNAGLGLSIVKKTMDLHQGRVEITETPGGGATVTLIFNPIELSDPKQIRAA